MGSWFSTDKGNDLNEKEQISIENSNNNKIEIHTEHLNALKSIKLYIEIALGVIVMIAIIFAIIAAVNYFITFYLR